MKSAFSINPVHIVPLHSYTYTFQSLIWHQRILNYIGSGKLLADYQRKRSGAVPPMQSELAYAYDAINQLEKDIVRIGAGVFSTAMGEYWRLLEYADNDKNGTSHIKADLMRLAFEYAFPGQGSILDLKKWPLWKLAAYIPSSNKTNVVTFNEPTKEAAYNRLVQAYLESEDCKPEQSWMISGVSLAQPDLTDEESYLFDFMQFAYPLVGNAFAIPVHVPDDAWVQGSQLDFIETPTYIQTNGICSNKGTKGTTA